MITRFHPGDPVFVRFADPPGHIRTPYYIRGKQGIVERICGHFGNPEELAYGRNGQPAQPLYRVRFAQSQVWSNYNGRPGDTIDIEIFEHWLEPVTEKSTHV